MIGWFRLLLAVMVVVNHVWAPVANKIGAHAVVAFFVISGFLMTKVIQEVYGTGIDGTIRFLTNRFLRIYPTYLVFLAASAALYLAYALLIDPAAMAKLPADAAEWFYNITLINLTFRPVILIPPAWSLTVEVFYYVAMALLQSRTRRIAQLWFAASLLFTIYLVATGAPYAERYYTVAAASIFFSLGAMIYFHFDALKVFRPRPGVLMIILPIYAFWPLLSEAMQFDPKYTGYYGAMIPLLLVLIPLLATESKSWRPVDRFLGDLAYPVFVSHLFVAAIVHGSLGRWVEVAGGVYAVIVLVLTFILSIAYLWLLDKPIQRLRTKFRGKTAARAQSPA